jgi:hypothetical protein
MFQLSIHKLFAWLFFRVLTTHRGGKGSIPGRKMSVWGSLFILSKLSFHFEHFSKDSAELVTKFAGTTYWDDQN